MDDLFVYCYHRRWGVSRIRKSNCNVPTPGFTVQQFAYDCSISETNYKLIPSRYQTQPVKEYCSPFLGAIPSNDTSDGVD